MLSKLAVAVVAIIAGLGSTVYVVDTDEIPTVFEEQGVYYFEGETICVDGPAPETIELFKDVEVVYE